MIAAALTVYRELPGLSNYFLITNETQLIDPGARRGVFMGRHKPIPGGLAAAVRAADTHENTTAGSWPLSASS